MDLFLLHFLLLVWLSLGAARQLTDRLGDILLAAALLAWGNVVATSLLLSGFNLLGDGAWFLGVSGLLAGLTCLGLQRLVPAPSAGPSEPPGPSRWLVGVLAPILTLLAGACFALVYAYEPNNADSLSYHLPRAMYYLGQGSLNHFDVADPRQTQLPFNYNLLQLFVLVHGAPLPCLNFINLCAWSAGGIALYRLGLLCGAEASPTLLISLLTLVTTGVIAQAATTTPELAVGVALLCAAMFFLRWRQDRLSRNAWLAGLAASLAMGSDLRAALLFIAGASGWLLWVRRRPDARSVLRPWRAPLLLATGLALPFAVINLANGELGFAVFGRPADIPGRDFWTGWWPWQAPGSSVLLNEDNAGFGLTGLLFLLGAGYLARCRRDVSSWLVWGALAWVAGVLICHRLSLRPRDFTPALLLAAPAVASLLGTAAFSRRAGRGLLAMVALTALWSTGVYLLKNTSRPLAPMLHASFVPPGVPNLPLLVEHRMTGQPWVNVDTDAADESIFPFMSRGRGQRFTSRSTLEPGAYNLLSRPAAGRNATWSTLDQTPAYVLVPVESKRTAGVEFLATIGAGSAARDYLGLGPHPGETTPISSNRTLLVTLYRMAGSKELVRIKLAGLNPADQAHLVVALQHDDGSNNHVATITADGETTVAITRPFRVLVFRAVDSGTGADIGSAGLEHQANSTTEAKPLDPTRASSISSLFVTDIVLSRSHGGIVCEGLLPVEGPFPQWDIPYIRWAREPLVRLHLPPTEGFTRLQLAFSFRLHVRQRGQVALYFNGQLVRHYTLEGQLNWVDETLDLPPQAGANILEFRDATHKTGPDWAEYLERYPDVKNHLLSANLPLEPGAESHFENKGRAEGRTVKMRELPELEPAYQSYYFMFRKLRLEGFKAP